ncbi:phospholipid carrier-dependent glycosyltransferase [Microaceticoccus formicicus]|uniref:phospholipid carrier-dependent glycosyltransferase n=1 Tax=Microaceticoccus formicicus TaxID=3118105 RepID=UPI003CD048E2|nr:phospholipid carrier-dependent glycosyltransferase [Peptoniphilaceae bacterium AMB_02]
MKKSEKKLIAILVQTAILVVFASVESLMMARRLLEPLPGVSELDRGVSYILLRFMTIISGALIVSVYSYITTKKLKVDKMYKLVSSVIVIISLLGIIFSGFITTKTIIYYIIIYLGLIYIIIRD